MSRQESAAEHALRHTLDGRWAQAIRWLNQAEQTDRLAHAGSVFVSSLAAVLEDSPDDVHSNELERTLLLGESGRLALNATDRERLVEILVSRFREDPDRALLFARYCPSAPSAASVLSQYGQSPRAAPAGAMRSVTAERPGTAAGSGLRSVFRSHAEAAFHAAASERLAPRGVFPNMAVSAIVEFEAVRGLLTSPERSAFFRLVVDFVITNETGRMPALCIELDGPSHKDHVRDVRDSLKERILSVAGGRLLRIPLSGDHHIDRVMERVREELQLHETARV